MKSVSGELSSIAHSMTCSPRINGAIARSATAMDISPTCRTCPTCDGKKTIKPEIEEIREEIRAWLGTDDFYLVCAFAALDPDRVEYAFRSALTWLDSD